MINENNYTNSYCHIADLTGYCQKNPIEEPMWNSKLAQKILEGKEFIKLSPKETGK